MVPLTFCHFLQDYDFFATTSDSEKFNQNLRTAMIHALTLRNKETITFFWQNSNESRRRKGANSLCDESAV